ncbi:MAG: pentapeptide repeat-containing protein [Cyanobacteria bacterium P01_A01_bin.84]
MNFSIKNWLAQNYIKIPSLKNLSSGNIHGLALRIINDENLKHIGAFDICIVKEVFEQPLAIAWEEMPAIATLAANLLNHLNQKNPLTRAEGTWLAFQITFLIGLQEIVATEMKLQRNWLDRAIVPFQEINNFVSEHTQLQGLLKNLSSSFLSDTQAEQALSQVTNSSLVQQMNHAAVCWLVVNGAEELQAKLIVQRLLNSFEGYLLKVVMENALALAQLQKFVGLGKALAETNHINDTQACGDKIDIYREYYRASLLQSLSQPLFTEFFTLKDIYVNLKGIPVPANSTITASAPISQSVDLMEWAQQQLVDLDNIAIIESEAGFGKTSFCKIFSQEIAWKFYPEWMPIFIPLRDIKYSNNLVKTLSFGLPKEYRANFQVWLEQEYPQCLLLLDGWDELPPFSVNNKNAKSIFLQQLLEFQQHTQHKIILTTRPNILIEAAACKKIAIAQLEQEELRQWFQNWAKVQSWHSAQNCFTFLKQTGAFSNRSKLTIFSNFVRQPLMLYLIAILHRDGFLDNEILRLAGNVNVTAITKKTAGVEWEIYQRLYHWLVGGYPLSDGVKTILWQTGSEHIHHLGNKFLSQDLSSNHVKLRKDEDGNVMEVMENVALSILLSGHNQITLNCESNIPSHQNIQNILPAFYFRIKKDKFRKSKAEISQVKIAEVEFTHPHLGKYLTAQALVNKLVAIAQRNPQPYSQSDQNISHFLLNSSVRVAQEVYNFFGYGILSEELEVLIIEGLRRKDKNNFSFEVLSIRLQEFWFAYCKGYWLDEGIVHQALQNFRALKNPLSIEQINAVTGFNIFLLLCACHQEMKVPFLPCGNPENKIEFNPEAFRVLISRMEVWFVNGFTKRLRYPKSLAFLDLSKANLSQVILTQTNLGEVNFSDSHIEGANLAGSCLQGANLTDANLTGANLTGANLANANLTGANLTGANLTAVNLNDHTNLVSACLFQAIISEENKEIALLNGAIFSLEEFQARKNLIPQEFYTNSSDTISDAETWSYDMPQIGQIESAEGELILPIDLQSDINNDETLLRSDISSLLDRE